MELSPVESFDFFFDAVWKKKPPNQDDATGDSLKKMIGDRVMGNIVDTILFQQGRPHKWLFTSAKTGEILKKQEPKLSTEHIVKTFKSRCKLMKGCKPYHMKSYIATIWYFSVEVDMSDNMYSRLVDEEELSHILSHHLFADIAAIQLYIGGWPNKGSGVFEHRVTMRESGVGHNHETVELASLPLDQQEVTMNTFNPDIERMVITEGHHDNIKFHAAKFTRVIEKAAHAKVVNVVYEVNLNSSMTPIFICARDIVLLRIPEKAGNIFTLRTKCADLKVDPSLLMKIENNKSEEKKSNHSHKDDGHHSHAHEEHHGSQQHQDNGGHTHTGQGPVSPEHDSSKKVKELLEEPTLNHDPHHELDMTHPTSTKKSSNKYERFAEYTFNRYPGGSGRPPRPATASGTFHRDKAKKEKTEKLSAPCGRNVRPSSASFHHQVATEATKSKSSYYLRLIRGNDDDDVPRDDYKTNKSRPASAPVSKAPFGSHGVAKGGRRSSGFESRLNTLRKGCTQCMGDYCGFANPEGSDTQRTINESGLEAEAGKISWKQFYDRISRVGESPKNCTQTIAFKSILLAKCETKYIESALDEVGFEMWQLYQQANDLDQISAGFTRYQLTRVVNRCKAESNLIIFSSQRNEKHSTWDATNLTYKRLVYSEALINVHPSRFYYTVPVCDDCYRIYTLMDQQREVVLFRRPDVYSISQDERAMMKKRQKYSDAYSALLLRERREERHRQDVENWNAALELEVDSDDDKDLQNTEEDDLMFEYGVHHHHHRSGKDAAETPEDEEVDNFPIDGEEAGRSETNNPLANSMESDGPIEYDFHREKSTETSRDKFMKRMDDAFDKKVGSMPSRGRASNMIDTKKSRSHVKNDKTDMSSPSKTHLQEIESTVKQVQPSIPKQPALTYNQHGLSKHQLRHPEKIIVDTLKGKGVSKEEHVYHKNAKGSMASWARILKESQADVPQTHKHPPHVGTKWTYYPNNHHSEKKNVVPIESQALRTSIGASVNKDMRRSKSAGISRAKSSTYFNIDKENIVVGKIRPKSAVEAATIAMEGRKPFVGGSKNIQMATLPNNALKRHKDTLKVYHNATRPSSSKTGKDYKLLPLNKYTTDDIEHESEKIEAAIRRTEKNKMKQQQREWALQEREQRRISPEKVHPTKGTSDSWRGTVIRADNKYIAGTDSPFGPAPVFELPVTNEDASAAIPRQPKKFTSPEMKFKREDDGKVVVQLSKTSNLVLPYEYEKAKMSEYEALTGYGENSLSISPCSSATTPSTSNIQTQ